MMLRLQERKTLETLQDYYARHDDLPSSATLPVLLGSVPERLLAALAKLVSEGFLVRDKGEYIPTERFFKGALTFGIPAGALASPLEDAVENVDWRALRAAGIPIASPSRLHAVQVNGDSMDDAGIHNGDIVVLDVGKRARVGDIVAAVVDGEWTLKRLIRDEAGCMALKPENRKYGVIHLSEESGLSVHGVYLGRVPSEEVADLLSFDGALVD